jgi:REP element-mobilizing transposase RayT
MRHARVKVDGTGCYHVVSRIVDRAFKLDDGEKEIFRRMMRKAEAFSGVRVLTYAIMSNHFHVLVEVPERGEVGESELRRRMTVLYGESYVAGRVLQWEEWRKNGASYLEEAERDRMLARMGDVSAFVKTLKQRYSMSYNARHKRTGTLWEERFKSVLVENGESAKAAVAAYIDLNPVRAKIVTDPKDYRWSGYGEACGGGALAREGLIAVHDSRPFEQSGAWRHVSARYRVFLYAEGEERRAAYGGQVVRKGIASAEVDQVLERNGRLPLPELLRCRVRYFTDGMAIGGKAFVERVFSENRGLFGPKRKDGARKMRFGEWGDLRTARALRVDAVRRPLMTAMQSP